MKAFGRAVDELALAYQPSGADFGCGFHDSIGAISETRKSAFAWSDVQRRVLFTKRAPLYSGYTCRNSDGTMSVSVCLGPPVPNSWLTTFVPLSVDN